jgi:mono/diheme cytochrome c family protein
MTRGYLGWLLMAALLLPAVALADRGQEILQSTCAQCHALTKPEHLTLERLWSRGGPDLYYAGDKFQRAWLVRWLQHPSRIRPAGELYAKHIRAGADHDVIDEATLTPHPALPAEEAEAVAGALMQLHSPDGLVKPGAYQPTSVNRRMGQLLFTKLRGCSSCHRSAPSSGGVSGPELYTAGERLQGDFIAAYLRHPQAFDPGVWMPVLELSDSDVQRLTGYILSLGKED